MNGWSYDIITWKKWCLWWSNRWLNWWNSKKKTTNYELLEERILRQQRDEQPPLLRRPRPNRPNVEGNIDDHEWELFKDSWRRYKTMTNLTTTEEIRLELRAACSNEVNKLLFEIIGAATLDVCTEENLLGHIRAVAVKGTHKKVHRLSFSKLIQMIISIRLICFQHLHPSTPSCHARGASFHPLQGWCQSIRGTHTHPNTSSLEIKSESRHRQGHKTSHNWTNTTRNNHAMVRANGCHPQKEWWPTTNGWSSKTQQSNFKGSPSHSKPVQYGIVHPNWKA